MTAHNNRIKEKTGEGMESLVRNKAYGFADNKRNGYSTSPATETATLVKGLWYVVLYSRRR